jgi:hypothetical protein
MLILVADDAVNRIEVRSRSKEVVSRKGHPAEYPVGTKLNQIEVRIMKSREEKRIHPRSSKSLLRL